MQQRRAIIRRSAAACGIAATFAAGGIMACSSNDSDVDPTSVPVTTEGLEQPVMTTTTTTPTGGGGDTGDGPTGLPGNNDSGGGGGVIGGS